MTETRNDNRELVGLALLEVDDGDAPHILEAHALLQEALGPEYVEDMDSFRGTVSLDTDDAVVPRLVCAVHNGRVEGVVLGTYLRNLNMGMVLYSAVRRAFQGLGVYAMLRYRLMSLLNRESGRFHSAEMDYLISEQEDGSALFERYTREWGAFVAPVDYEQPAAQGLSARKLKLVLQPVAKQVPPSGDEIAAIVREIYERVYRLPNTTANAQFRRVVESLNGHALSGKELPQRA